MSSNRARDDCDVEELKYQRRRRRRWRQQRSDQVKTESLALHSAAQFLFFPLLSFSFAFFLLIIYLSVFLVFLVGPVLWYYTSPRAHLYIWTNLFIGFSLGCFMCVCVWGTSALSRSCFCGSPPQCTAICTEHRVCVISIYLTQSRWRARSARPYYTLHGTHIVVSGSWVSSQMPAYALSAEWAAHVCAMCTFCRFTVFTITQSSIRLYVISSSHSDLRSHGMRVFVSFVYQCISTRSSGLVLVSVCAL